MQLEKIKNVVVRGTNWVGDAAMSVPALRALRRVLPDAKITLCTRSWARGIFADAEFIDDILVYDKRGNSLSSVFGQAKQWRARKFDAAILFNNAFESAVLAQLGGAKTILGYRTDGRGFLLTDGVNVPEWKNERHEIYYYLNLIAALDEKINGRTDILESAPEIELIVAEKRKAAAREILKENGANLSKKMIAFCPGSTNSRAKRWSAENYAKLNDLIYANLNADVILFGAPDETEVSQAVFDAANIKPIFLTGKTDLSEAVAILSVVDLLVTNDTGPAHVAPALGTKTIVIFGPTNPLTTRPFSDLAEIIRKPLSCAPCMLRDCPIDHRCLTAILPQEIFDNLLRRLF